MTQRVKPIVALTFAISLVAAACASSGDGTAAPSSTTVAPTTTAAPTTTTTAAPTTTTTTTPETTTTAAPDDGGEYTFVEITDDSGILSLSVPTAWSDIDGTGWGIDGVDAGIGVAAAPDIVKFLETWETPGVFFGITDKFPDEAEGWLLDEFRYAEDCTLETADTWNGSLSGPFEVWKDCGGRETVRVILEVYPPSREYVAILEIQGVADIDAAAIETILGSFEVAPHR